MIDSTWLTPVEQCCGSSGMPQTVTLWVRRGMRAVYSKPRAMCRPSASMP